MHIELDIPDFPEDEKRNIIVFYGIEERVRLFPDGRLQVKTAQCNKCGICCMKVMDKWKFGKDPETGWCARLYYSSGDRGYMCGLGTSRPWACCRGDHAEKEHCSITWKTTQANR